MEYIAQLAVLLNVDKQKIVFLANLARVILTQDLDEYKTDIFNEYDVFDCYLNKFEEKFDVKIIRLPAERLRYVEKENQTIYSYYSYSEQRREILHTYYIMLKNM